MLNVGIDYHQRQSAICVLDGNGKSVREIQIKGYWPKLIEALKEIKREFSEEIRVCFEATTDSGNLHDRLREITNHVKVGNPNQLRLIFKSKQKNDRADARNLAKLLFLDSVPTVYVPQKDVRSWRAMIEYRSRLIEKRTKVKNNIRSHLRSQGVIAPRKLWTVAGIEWLREIEFENSLDQLHLKIALDDYFHVSENVKLVEKELNRIGRSHPGVHLLMTIPGIGMRTAEALVAYIDDPHRFERISQIGSYFGLVPSQHSSAGKEMFGRITRQGPGTVRRLITEATWMAVRRSPTIRAYFDRIVQDKKDRRKKAVIATAHYLTRVSLAMLKSGEVWRESVKVQ